MTGQQHLRIRAEQLIFFTWTLCKMFDTVPHDTLVSKWEGHGFDGWMTQWIKNWLDGCTQSCGQQLTVHGESSDKWCPSGVNTGASTVQHLCRWRGTEGTRSMFTDSSLCAAADTLQGRDAIQGCHPEGPGQAWELGLCKPHDVQQGEAQGSTPGSWQSQTHLQVGRGSDWEQLLIESSPVEKDLGVMVDENSIWAGNVHWQPRKPKLSWAASKAAWAAGWEGILLSCMFKARLDMALSNLINWDVNQIPVHGRAYWD